MEFIRKFLAIVLVPVLAIAGAGLFTYAIYLILPMAGLAVGGAFLLAAAYDASRE